MTLTTRAPIVALLALAAISVHAGEAPRKYLLKEPDEVGDVSRIESEFSTELLLSGPQQEMGAPPLILSHRSREVKRAERLTPAASRYVYSVARSVEVTPDGEKVDVSSLQGKTVTVKTVNGKRIVTVAKGTISAKDRARLQEAGDGPSSFPAHPVAVGDEWELDAKKLARSFGDLGAGGTASARGRFVEVVEHAGQECARVAMTLNLEGRPKGQPFKMGFQLSGDLYHSLKWQRTLLVDLKGPLSMEGTTQGIAVRGEGTARMVWKQQCLKVAGKPVAGP
jgi:hypothetical protein